MADASASPDKMAEENERLRKEIEDLKAGRSGGGWDKARRWLTPVVGVLAVVCLVATTIGVWVNRTVWNEEKYIERVVPVAGDPAVIEVMATKLTDEAMVALDVENRVSEALAAIASDNDLPEQITFLAGPLTDSIRDLVHGQAVKFLSSDTFQTYWEQVNAKLHPKVVALLKGDYEELPNVTVGEEVVQIDLVPILAEILRDLVEQGVEGLNIDVTIPDLSGVDTRAAIEKLSFALGVPLPEDFGQVTIMTSAELESYQTTANTLRAIGWILLFLTVVLMALTLVLARDRRRAVVWLGLGTTAAIIVATVILRNVSDSVLDSISSQQAQDAARAIVKQFGSSLRGAGAIVAWTGLIVGIVAYLLGRPRWLGRSIDWARGAASGAGGTQLDSWVAEHADGVRIVAVAVAVLAIFIAGFNLLSVIVVGALLGGVLWYVASAQGKADARA